MIFAMVVPPGFDPNVVPCCGRCNVAKSTMTQVEFLALVRSIYEHRL